MTSEPKMEPEISLSLSDMDKVIRDDEIRKHIADGTLDQDTLLDRLLDMFGAEEADPRPG